jgi:signal transduction histidine kinase
VAASPVGLGLAIVRDVAAYHGGQLILENRSEGGLRASLVLVRSRSL